MSDIGWNGIFIEQSPNSAILRSKISNFFYGVIVEFSDQVAIIGNTIFDNSFQAILSNNGKSVYIGNNTLSGSQGCTAIWANDEWGTIANNEFIDNCGGILLCNYTELFGNLTPSGAPLDAVMTATGWKIRGNNFNNNEVVAISVRDGANLNLIESSNTFANTGDFDINIPPDEDIPNFLFIPKAFNNTVISTDDVTVRDCGADNTIIGGILSTDCE